MIFLKLLFRFSFYLLIILLCLFLLFYFLNPIFTSTTIIIPYGLHPFSISENYSVTWEYIKAAYIIFYILSIFIISNSIYNVFFKNLTIKNNSKKRLAKDIMHQGLTLYIGEKSDTLEKVYLTEKSLYQNILITGTIGSGKTSSAMYPFTEQLIKYKKEKLGMLILDVKGNYYKYVSQLSIKYEREDDLNIIELGGDIKYNPLHKPNLKASVLANRLRTILTLFSTNNQDSYWLDKAEQFLTECIKLCRLYNNGYVTFLELHKLITSPSYYKEKISLLRENFQSGIYNQFDSYNLLSSLEFFETELTNLDTRILSIIQSEITRITNTFISDLSILNTFCPKKEELNFYGFHEIISKKKIVVLNMNIAEYKNLSKIIAAYLKLDFQGEVLSQLSSDTPPTPTAFISDEYHEYVTATDSDFFAQAREAKCINIVATQSYTSLLNTLKEPYIVKTIIQNLINKLWFRTDDEFTIDDAQKQIGKENKTRISKSISENAKETNYDYFSNTLKSKDSNISESLSTQIQPDFVFDSSFFTQELDTFTCLSFLSNGEKILKPCKINMIPYFKIDASSNNHKVSIIN